MEVFGSALAGLRSNWPPICGMGSVWSCCIFCNKSASTSCPVANIREQLLIFPRLFMILVENIFWIMSNLGIIQFLGKSLLNQYLSSEMQVFDPIVLRFVARVPSGPIAPPATKFPVLADTWQQSLASFRSENSPSRFSEISCIRANTRLQPVFI